MSDVSFEARAVDVLLGCEACGGGLLILGPYDTASALLFVEQHTRPVVRAWKVQLDGFTDWIANVATEGAQWQPPPPKHPPT